jgi:tellurite resistance protein TerC
MGTPWFWIGFNAFVLAAIALDLGVFHRRPREIRLREAAAWSVAWAALALLFGLGILHWHGGQRALEYFTGYIIEQSLSVDNLFVFLILFQTFRVDPQYRQRVLGWGILGALVMRAMMIAAGVALIQRFSWVLYLFGAFLLYAGAHMLFAKERERHPERSPVLQFISRRLRMTEGYRGEHFFVREAARRLATPLFLVLLVVEITDVTFALDSIPAVFGITRDPFIVYTSNVFAILGLRSLYFLLAGVLQHFRFLSTGLSFVLLFIGAKMLAEPWLHVSSPQALGVVGGILAVALLASWLAGPARIEPASTHPGSFKGGTDD